MNVRKAKSRAWMQAHVADPYVQRAAASGYRSRAAYKLIEIVDRDRLLRRGQTVVDLGAAPGSWSQVLVERVMPGGLVVALDLLPMEPLNGAHVIQGTSASPAYFAKSRTRWGAKE